MTTASAHLEVGLVGRRPGLHQEPADGRVLLGRRFVQRCLAAARRVFRRIYKTNTLDISRRQQQCCRDLLLLVRQVQQHLGAWSGRRQKQG